MRFSVFKGSKDGLPRGSTTLKPDELVSDQVLVRVTASGVCGTDLHYKTEDMVLGHEGIGIIEQLGPGVKHLKEGDRVGWGYQHDSCGLCIQCLQGEEMFCPERAIYGVANRDQGSFSSHAIWREAFLYPIPQTMSDEAAAPLQCGGSTVFEALRGIKATETVGVLGVGGLGHLAVQFAAKMGCRVIVFSGTRSKEDQVMDLGAHRFVATNSGVNLQKPITRLLVTSSMLPDWETILPLMAPRSQIYPLTISHGNLVIPYMPLLSRGIRIQGSIPATRAVQREMLAFAALHDIVPVTETFPMTAEGIKEAMDKLERGEVRYRAVLLSEGQGSARIRVRCVM